MTGVYELSNEQVQVLTKVAVRGTRNAATVLSEMVGQDIRVTAPKVQLVPLKDVAREAGGPEVCSVGIYLGVSGDIAGHMVLIFPLHSAFQLVDLLMECPPGTTTVLEEIEQSALAELGNVTGSSFLNALSDFTRLKICPSPPAVVVDMVGAIIDTVLADLSLVSEEAFIVETTFSENAQEIKGIFFLVPDPLSLETILQSLGADE